MAPVTDRSPEARAALAHNQHMTHNPKICPSCQKENSGNV